MASRARKLLHSVRMRFPPSTRVLEALLHDTNSRIAYLERRLAAVQGLTARVYEHQHGWAEQLEQIRSSAGYEEAFSGEPLVSVRIPTYDRPGKLFDRALASVRRQSYEHWEAIVIGDGCEPGVVREVERRLEDVGDPRIRFWNLPHRTQYPDEKQARWQVTGVRPSNVAMERSQGAWIAPIDDDDEWSDDHLELLVGAAQRERAELAYGRMHVVLEGDGEVPERRTEFGAWPPQSKNFGFQAAVYHAHLKDFRLDMNAWLADEVWDWNLARRMLDAGVRFTFLDHPVGTYYVPADYIHRKGWQEAAERLGGGED